MGFNPSQGLGASVTLMYKSWLLAMITGFQPLSGIRCLCDERTEPAEEPPEPEFQPLSGIRCLCDLVAGALGVAVAG